jgi:hypothetical protein
MKEEITKTGENPSVESIIIGKLMDVNKQVGKGSENIIVGVNDDESSKLKISKEEFANMIRVKVEDTFPLILTFDRYDDNWNAYFNTTDFQKQRVDATNKLLESGREDIAYLKEYKYLIVSCGPGIMGEISEVKLNQIHEAAYMVERLNCMYGWISSRFVQLKNEYYKQYEA